jgi:hypothetical protein
MSDFKSAKDLIAEDNVVTTWTEGKYVCFKLDNGFVVKLNPNEAPRLKGE